MDFSNNAFRTRPPTTLSADNMSHAKLVQSCRFGWSTGPDDLPRDSMHSAPNDSLPTYTNPISDTRVDARAKRLTPCRGRLYHQLTCAHRVRTDLVMDCGSNCLEPYTYTTVSDVPFYCQECVDQESSRIWNTRCAELDSQFPSRGSMTPDQYNRWYEEYHALEARYAVDRVAYEKEQRVGKRPTNISSALEMSKEEESFAMQLDGLSLSLMSAYPSATSSPSPPLSAAASSLMPSTIHLQETNEIHPTTANTKSTERHSQSQPNSYHPYSRPRPRITLPTDSSEQLHWGLNSLNIDRGSCGFEYSPVQAPLRQQQAGVAEEDSRKSPRG